MILAISSLQVLSEFLLDDALEKKSNFLIFFDGYLIQEELSSA